MNIKNNFGRLLESIASSNEFANSMRNQFLEDCDVLFRIIELGVNPYCTATFRGSGASVVDMPYAGYGYDELWAA